MNTKSSLANARDLAIDPVENSLLELVSHLIIEIIKENASRQNDETSDAEPINN